MLLYRDMVPADIGEMIALRLTQLREEGGSGPDLTEALRDYYRRHLADGSFHAVLALSNEKVIGTGGLSLAEKPPYYGCPGGRLALLSSMYTDPAFRRQGVATEILARLTAWARQRGCGTIQITASEAGRKLYTAFGFQKNERFMEYRLLSD